MGKEVTKQKDILSKIKNTSEYKTAQQDKTILEGIFKKLNGSTLFINEPNEKLVWPNPKSNKTKLPSAKGKPPVYIQQYKLNKIYVGTIDIDKKLKSYNPKIIKKGVEIRVGMHPVQFIETGANEGLNAYQVTRLQELGSAAVFKRAINDNKTFNKPDDILNDKVLMKELKDIWAIYNQDNVDLSWIESFQKQTVALLKKVGRPEVHAYNREGGFMEYLEKKILPKHFKITKKDNWDPADIWLIRHEDKAREIIDDLVMRGGGDTPIFDLNAKMRAMFHNLPIPGSQGKDSDPAVFGISLKKIGSGDAEITFSNHTDDFFKSLDATEMTYLHTVCDLSVKDDKNGVRTLGTQDSKFVVENGVKETYSFQIKANDSKKLSGLKYEPTLKGASAARVGKATVDLVIDKMTNNYYRLKFDKTADHYPTTADKFRKEEAHYKTLIQALMNKTHVTTNVKTVEEAIDNIFTTFGTQPHVANNKLQQITWLNQILSLPKAKLDNFATDLVFISKKEGRRYGPFAKIY